MFRLLGFVALAAIAVTSAARADLVDDCYAAGQTDPDKTIEICTRAINEVKTENDRMSTAFNNRGHSKIYKKDFDGARADIERAIQLNPKNQYAYDNLGDMWRDRGNFDEAIKAYNQALRADPSFLSAIYNRGLTYERMGNLSNARADYERVTKTKSADREIDRWAIGEARAALDRLAKR